jgi:D-glycero-D-manno-heptose 1,7-bisphosphate phosphatase
MTASRRAVFLDRDGVLDEPVVVDGGERPPWKLEELRIVGDARAALDRLREAGLAMVVVTNQPDVGRGTLDRDMAELINFEVKDALGVDAIYSCFHSGAEPCACRKPAPGMIFAAARDLELAVEGSWLVGDRWVDIAAGRSVGLRTVLLRRVGSWGPSSGVLPPRDLQPDHIATSLTEAVSFIVGPDSSTGTRSLV